MLKNILCSFPGKLFLCVIQCCSKFVHPIYVDAPPTALIVTSLGRIHSRSGSPSFTNTIHWCYKLAKKIVRACQLQAVLGDSYSNVENCNKIKEIYLHCLISGMYLYSDSWCPTDFDSNNIIVLNSS